jgi:hypothetical protein
LNVATLIRQEVCDESRNRYSATVDGFTVITLCVQIGEGVFPQILLDFEQVLIELGPDAVFMTATWFHANVPCIKRILTIRQ